MLCAAPPGMFEDFFVFISLQSPSDWSTSTRIMARTQHLEHTTVDAASRLPISKRSLTMQDLPPGFVEEQSVSQGKDGDFS